MSGYPLGTWHVKCTSTALYLRRRLDRLATITTPGCYSWLHRAGHGLAPRRRGCPISIDGGTFAAYRVGHAPPGSFSSGLISSPVPRQSFVNGGGRESICVLTQIQLCEGCSIRLTESCYAPGSSEKHRLAVFNGSRASAVYQNCLSLAKYSSKIPLTRAAPKSTRPNWLLLSSLH